MQVISYLTQDFLETVFNKPTFLRNSENGKWLQGIYVAKPEVVSYFYGIDKLICSLEFSADSIEDSINTFEVLEEFESIKKDFKKAELLFLFNKKFVPIDLDHIGTASVTYKDGEMHELPIVQVELQEATKPHPLTEYHNMMQ